VDAEEEYDLKMVEKNITENFFIATGSQDVRIGLYDPVIYAGWHLPAQLHKEGKLSATGPDWKHFQPPRWDQTNVFVLPSLPPSEDLDRDAPLGHLPVRISPDRSRPERYF